MCRRSVSKDAYVLSDYDTGRDRESKGEVSVTSPALCHFFSFPLDSLIMKVHSSISDNLSGKMIESFHLLCWSWFSLVLRDHFLTNTRIPLQRYRLAVYDRRPGESRVHWISFGITVLVEIGSRKNSSVVASNDNKTGVKRRH